MPKSASSWPAGKGGSSGVPRTACFGATRIRSARPRSAWSGEGILSFFELIHISPLWRAGAAMTTGRTRPGATLLADPEDMVGQGAELGGTDGPTPLGFTHLPLGAADLYPELAGFLGRV